MPINHLQTLSDEGLRFTACQNANPYTAQDILKISQNAQYASDLVSRMGKVTEDLRSHAQIYLSIKRNSGTICKALRDADRINHREVAKVYARLIVDLWVLTAVIGSEPWRRRF